LYIAVMFHRARATLCLHSFPTRRSSDLLPQPAGRTALTMELFPLFFTALALGLLGGGHCIGMCGGLMGALTMAIPAPQRRGWPLDRKSTRLNSSHVKSSYAVFCLEKKNE